MLPRSRATVSELGDPRVTAERFAQLERNLAEITRRLHDLAPDCTVLFVDYLTILPPAGQDPAAPPPADIAAWGRMIAARLAATTRAAADGAGLGYVAASSPGSPSTMRSARSRSPSSRTSRNNEGASGGRLTEPFRPSPAQVPR